jgi:hypothetical protein
VTFPLPVLARRQFLGDSNIPHVFTEEELRVFLEDSSNLQNSLNLWNQKSGYPNLLNAREKAEIERERKEKTLRFAVGLLIAYWIFSPNTGVYQYGYYDPVSNRYKPIPGNAVRLAILRIAKATELEIRSLSLQLINGMISREKWYSSVSSLLRTEYQTSWLAGIGGIENMTSYELQRFYEVFSAQFRWLNNFMEEIISGKQPLNGRLVTRAAMYARAGNGFYQNNLLRIAERNGFREVRRILGPNENHCSDKEVKNATRPGCLELWREGWMPIWQMTPIAEALCLSNCLCSLKFRR